MNSNLKKVQKRRNRFKFAFETVLLIHTINPN